MDAFCYSICAGLEVSVQRQESNPVCGAGKRLRFLSGK